ncbi:MAG: helix-turn-helix transcriptional regulator [Actinomycetota bacterium]|nr:helix-turn-helix transcriptional regulator [Actinomycetota bacterium]
MTQLSTLLTDATARAALARRDIPEVFSQLHRAGISQAAIARATGQHTSEVSEIISGRQVQSVALLERIADGLGISPGAMGLAYSSGGAPETEVADDGTEEDRRREQFRHAGAVLFGEPVFGTPSPIRDRECPTPVAGRIGPSDVQRTADTTVRLDELGGNLGGVAAVSALTAHARCTEAMLGADMTEPVRLRVLQVLSDVHRSTGWAAGDAGLRDLARQHFSRAMTCGGAAGDRRRVIDALLDEGRAELHFGTPNDALKLFQLGAAAASTPLDRASAESHRGRALGALGLAEEALAALRRLRVDAAYAEAELTSPEMFRTSLHYVEGSTHFALGRFDRAAAAFAMAESGMGHATRCLTLTLGELAAAQLRAGELAAGLRTAGRVVGLARTLRSAWVRVGLAPLQEAAAARRDSACRDLAHELAMVRSAV